MVYIHVTFDQISLDKIYYSWQFYCKQRRFCIRNKFTFVEAHIYLIDRQTAYFKYNCTLRKNSFADMYAYCLISGMVKIVIIVTHELH